MRAKALSFFSRPWIHLQCYGCYCVEEPPNSQLSVECNPAYPYSVCPARTCHDVVSLFSYILLHPPLFEILFTYSLNDLGGKENAMTAVQVAKKELRRKIHNLLKDIPRESVTAQCSDTVRTTKSLPKLTALTNDIDHLQPQSSRTNYSHYPNTSMHAESASSSPCPRAKSPPLE